MKNDKNNFSSPPGTGSHTSVVSIEALDEKVQAFDMGPHPEWVDSYLVKMNRRINDDISGDPTGDNR